VPSTSWESTSEKNNSVEIKLERALWRVGFVGIHGEDTTEIWENYLPSPLYWLIALVICLFLRYVWLTEFSGKSLFSCKYIDIWILFCNHFGFTHT